LALRLSEEPLIGEQAIAERVRELAEELSRVYVDTVPVFLVVLKGSVYFATDLARAMSVPIEIEFIRAESYSGTDSRGEVEFVALPREPIGERAVLIVEDILDTGLTSSRLVDWVKLQGAASVRICTLLNKPSSRKANVEADLWGFEISNEFVVGYGLDYEQRYRELPAIYTLNHDD
jgi:hypoxanthine phosphoribosyltransferase